MSLISGDAEELLLTKHATIVQNQVMAQNVRSRQGSTEDEQEYVMVRRRMNSSLKKVAKSNFYKNIVQQLENNVDMKSKFSRALGSHTHMPLVIYDLGSIQFSITYQLRLSLALLLKQDFSHMIDSLQVHISSINMNDIELRVMKDMGCDIIINDSNCVKYRIDRPTLLYLPYANSETIANLIEENWFPATRLNQIVILSNSLKDIVREIGSVIKEVDGKFEICTERLTQKNERLRYVWVVQKFCTEIGIDERMWNLYKQKFWEHRYYIEVDEEERPEQIFWGYRRNETFSTFGLHFFNFDCDTDLKSLLPSFSWSMKLPPGQDVKAWNQARYIMDEEDMVESSKLVNDIKDIMKGMEESDFYVYIRDKLKKPEIKLLLSHMLGTENKVQMVLYGVGSIEQNYESQIQFALALLLKKHSDIPIGDIEILDSKLTVADKKAMSDMGCMVLDLDLKYIWRRVQKPTFFFIYQADSIEMASIFEANFCPLRMNKICIFSRDFNGYYYDYYGGLSRHNRHLIVDHRRLNISYYGYERTLMKHTICFRVGKLVDTWNFLQNMFLKFYVVDNDTDLYTCLPRVTVRELVKCHNARDQLVGDGYFDYVASMHDYNKFLIQTRFNGESDDEDKANEDDVNDNDDGVNENNDHDVIENVVDDDVNENYGGVNENDDDLNENDDDEDDINENDEDNGNDVINDNNNVNDINDLVLNDDDDDGGVSDFNENPDYLEIRWPVRLRRTWNRPQSGWLKLNFSGNQESKGYGGVIHNEHGKLLVSYAGYIRDPKANEDVEALRHGSRCISTYFSDMKMIVEGDSLPLILWANGRYPGDWRHEKALSEIYKARKGKNWAFVHVYPEANNMAEEMAVRGAELCQICRIWDHRGSNLDQENGASPKTEDGNEICGITS